MGSRSAISETREGASFCAPAEEQTLTTPQSYGASCWASLATIQIPYT
jgi:hypothetical protein